jgi:hypothetical protein
MPNFGWNWSVEPVGGWSQLEHSDTCWCKLYLNGRKQPDPVYVTWEPRMSIFLVRLAYEDWLKHADTRTLGP